MMSKIAVISGGTSGIGLAAAQALRAKGFIVYELSRREGGAEGIIHLRADISDKSSVDAAIAEILSREGRIDLLINNAGFGISGAVEFTSVEAAKKLFDVNFFGMVNLCHAVLPSMRTRGGGRIINLSSVAAVAPIPFQTFYSAGKAAVNSYSMALANEVRPFGISVAAVMPGDTKTGFTSSREKSSEGDELYGGRISKSVASMEKDEQNGMPPEAVGSFIARLADKKHIKPLYTVGITYKLLSFLLKHLPCSFDNFVLGRLYAS